LCAESLTVGHVAVRSFHVVRGFHVRIVSGPTTNAVGVVNVRQLFTLELLLGMKRILRFVNEIFGRFRRLLDLFFGALRY